MYALNIPPRPLFIQMTSPGVRGDVVLCYGSPRLGVPERFYARVTCTGEGGLVGNCGGLAREEGEVEWRGKA